ncbi:MAG: ABC transporter substrate-binding protein [Promethearchaeota archaeon]|jgi:ABC-type transport system substrate-binding protein
MKRKTTLLILSLFLVTPFFNFLPVIPVRGQTADATLIVGTLANFLNFDPLIGEGGISAETRDWCYETLYKIEHTDPDDPAFYIVPWLVDSETVSANGLHVNLSLRQGIEFWNGMPFNASVVKWNMDRQRDCGQSFYGQWGAGSYQAIIQWTWHSIEAFLDIPGNDVYNDSALYPELWWNKDDSRYPPEYWDGTNQTLLSNLQWPRDIGNWTGRSVWNPEPVWDVYTNTIKNLSGNFPSGELNSNVLGNVTTYAHDPYLITLNLYFPAWTFWKTTSLYTMSMIFPDGTYDAGTDTFAADGPLYYPGDEANPNYKQKYMDVKGPAYTGLMDIIPAAAACIGTGPYILTEYNAAEQWMTLDRNDNYWGGNWMDTNRPSAIVPNMTDVIVQRYDTTESLYTALLDGELDYAIMEGQWADYENQINAKVSLNLSEQYAVGGVFDYRMNPYEVDKTLRYAMSFAFQYDHAADPDVEGNYVIPTKGPFWDGLFSDYTTDELHPIMTHDGSGTEVGFYFNLTEARWWLLHNDSWGYTNQPWTHAPLLPNGTKEADRATTRGLTDSSDDDAWRAVANGPDPIATLSCLDHADYDHWFDNFKAYMALIGIKVVPYGPVSSADYYPFEITENRWNTDGTAVKQTWRSSYIATYPHLFNVVKWHLDDVLGIGDPVDPLDAFAVWNSWPYLPSKIDLTTDWAASQGHPGYTPTNPNMRQNIHSWPFITDPTQLMLDYGTVMDQVYQDALSIWMFKPAGFACLHKGWTWDGRKPDTTFGRAIFNFKQTGWVPPVAPIPGFTMGIFIGITMLSVVGLVYILKKKRM